MSDLGTFYRNTDPWTAAEAYPKYGHPINDRHLLDRLSPLVRVEALTAPLLLVHGANDTNVPAGESRQMFEALRRLGRRVECLIFDEEGHAIVKRENRAVLVKTITEWLIQAFTVST
jgi:dipeptidyl aminopeptidase/acylaminoacyl peptidase